MKISKLAMNNNADASHKYNERKSIQKVDSAHIRL